MKKNVLFLALTAALALSACDSKPAASAASAPAVASEVAASEPASTPAASESATMGASASSPEAAQKAIASEIAKAEQTAAAEDAAEAKRESDIVAKAKAEIPNIKLHAACDELKAKMVACTKDEVDAEVHLKDLRAIAEEPADEQADSCKEELANFKCE
ncbi:hypothetical protein HpSP79_07540 [Helicobacter pylori]